MTVGGVRRIAVALSMAAAVSCSSGASTHTATSRSPSPSPSPTSERSSRADFLIEAENVCADMYTVADVGRLDPGSATILDRLAALRNISDVLDTMHDNASQIAPTAPRGMEAGYRRSVVGSLGRLSYLFRKLARDVRLGNFGAARADMNAMPVAAHPLDAYAAKYKLHDCRRVPAR